MIEAIRPVSAPMPALDSTRGLALLIGCLAASGLLTFLSIRYARHRQLLDLPGHRRSHSVPTPRGGGVAPVLVVLAGGAWIVAQDAQAMPALVVTLIGLAAVAGVGWIDDHRSLPIIVRLAVHVAAALAASVALLGMPRSLSDGATVAAVTFLVSGLVNAWNFMDGIDGIASSQAMLVLAAVAAGGWLAGAWLDFGWLALAAVAGFLPFNLPRARIFLGDVGSGALGYLVAVILLRAATDGGVPSPLVALPVSACVIDAGMTLAMRLLSGRKWWRPHREHLYQWLVRRGNTHARVMLGYALWTAAAGALAVEAGRRGMTVGLAVTIGVIPSGILLWVGVRNRIWNVAIKRR